MKKIVLTLVAVLTMTSAVAQEKNQEFKKQGKEMRQMKEMTPEQRTERMAKQLSLTDDQKSQLLQLNTEYADVLKGPGMRGPRPNRQSGTDGSTGASEQKRPERPQMTDAQREQMKQQMEKRQEYDKKLQGILTDAQYKEYQKMQPRPGRGHGPKGMGKEKPATT